MLQWELLRQSIGSCNSRFSSTVLFLFLMRFSFILSMRLFKRISLPRLSNYLDFFSISIPVSHILLMSHWFLLQIFALFLLSLSLHIFIFLISNHYLHSYVYLSAFSLPILLFVFSFPFLPFSRFFFSSHSNDVNGAFLAVWKKYCYTFDHYIHSSINSEDLQRSI